MPIALAIALVIPAGAVALPSQANKSAAREQCQLERGTTRDHHRAFRAQYQSFSRCVRENAVEEAAEQGKARKNAARECREERTTMGNEAFAGEYGTTENDRNAFGKCVSLKARAMKARMDAADEQKAEERQNAAETCGDERDTLGVDAFRAKYGTGEGKRNAFGKCVSTHARSS